MWLYDDNDGVQKVLFHDNNAWRSSRRVEKAAMHRITPFDTTLPVLSVVEMIASCMIFRIVRYTLSYYYTVFAFYIQLEPTLGLLGGIVNRDCITARARLTISLCRIQILCLYVIE